MWEVIQLVLGKDRLGLLGQLGGGRNGIYNTKEFLDKERKNSKVETLNFLHTYLQVSKKIWNFENHHHYHKLLRHFQTA